MKVIDNIKTHMKSQYKYVADPTNVGMMKMDSNISSTQYNMHKYNTSVEIGRSFICRPEDQEQMERDTIEEIRELLYGEIKSDLLELRYLAHENIPIRLMVDKLIYNLYGR